ncbi:MAG: hypothetical protein M1817_006150 [Caeruleum heppii]|nr:MAG: hypothetical protein M1817_006150 [Caeruleum heppii]
MSTKRLSPSAALLRSSRLFSLPPPVAAPGPDLTSAISHASDTATLPYPTHAALTTPRSSLARGDWGLKRPLPLRSTAFKTNPSIRVEALDTREHVTDFWSAMDHTLTLLKWQEMNVPISAPNAQARPRASDVGRLSSDDPGSFKSVFESTMDKTHDEDGQNMPLSRRWKFKGPWLAGKTEQEFHDYIRREIRKRKREFRDHIRRHLQQQKAAEARRLAMEEGRIPQIADLASPTSISDTEVQDYVAYLRQDQTTLIYLIHNFLDLPSVPQSNYLFGSTTVGTATSVFGETGPPVTHPSAGLSYLRTASYLENHPIHGPQAQPAPVQARILTPRRSPTGQNNVAKLGVAGVVADDSVHASFRVHNALDEASGVSSFKTDIPGGAKIWIHPSRASIDTQGMIKLQTTRAARAAIEIRQGVLLDQRGSKDSIRSTPTRTARSPKSAASRGYGLGDATIARLRGDLESAPPDDQSILNTYRELENLLSSKDHKTG